MPSIMIRGLHGPAELGGHRVDDGVQALRPVQLDVGDAPLLPVRIVSSS
jgi:hypothetical protein